MSSEPRPMIGLNLSSDQERQASAYDGSISHSTGTPPMSSNVKIPDWAEKAAQDFHNKWDTGMSGAAFRDLVRALLAAEQRGMEKAGHSLAKAEQALKDWLHVYAPDLCKPENVAAAQDRIGAQGTIAYIADALAAIRSLGETP